LSEFFFHPLLARLDIAAGIEQQMTITLSDIHQLQQYLHFYENALTALTILFQIDIGKILPRIGSVYVSSIPSAACIKTVSLLNHLHCRMLFMIQLTIFGKSWISQTQRFKENSYFTVS